MATVNPCHHLNQINHMRLVTPDELDAAIDISVIDDAPDAPATWT